MIEDHLRTAGIDAGVSIGEGGLPRVRYSLPTPAPAVQVIVPTTLREGVDECLEGVLQGTRYEPLTVTVAVDLGALDDRAKQARLDRFAGDPRVDVFAYPTRPFNYSWVNNAAVARGETPLVCLLNDDVRVIEPDWLETMVGHVVQPGVGVVGARLLYPDDTVQHGGVILGAVGVAAHAHHGLPRTDPGYRSRAILDQDLSCVTAACAVIRREAFEEVEGFDEQLAIAFNDVDLCIRLRARGWRIVLAAGAELYHDESASVGPHDAPERTEQYGREHRLMKERWGVLLKGDPHYSPNLDLRHPGTLAFPPRATTRGSDPLDPRG